MPQSLSAVYVQAVFSTMNRNPYLHDSELRRRMHGYLVGTSKGLGCPTIQVGGTADHVHVLAILGRTTTQADWIRDLKRASAKWVKPQVPDFAWQAGYGMFSVGHDGVEAVKAYVANQEEYLQMLKDYGLECDERYLWD